MMQNNNTKSPENNNYLTQFFDITNVNFFLNSNQKCMFLLEFKTNTVFIFNPQNTSQDQINLQKDKYKISYKNNKNVEKSKSKMYKFKLNFKNSQGNNLEYIIQHTSQSIIQQWVQIFMEKNYTSNKTDESLQDTQEQPTKDGLININIESSIQQQQQLQVEQDENYNKQQQNLSQLQQDQYQIKNTINNSQLLMYKIGKFTQLYLFKNKIQTEQQQEKVIEYTATIFYNNSQYFTSKIDEIQEKVEKNIEENINQSQNLEENLKQSDIQEIKEEKVENSNQNTTNQEENLKQSQIQETKEEDKDIEQKITNDIQENKENNQQKIIENNEQQINENNEQENKENDQQENKENNEQKQKITENQQQKENFQNFDLQFGEKNKIICKFQELNQNQPQKEVQQTQILQDILKNILILEYLIEKFNQNNQIKTYIIDDLQKYLNQYKKLSLQGIQNQQENQDSLYYHFFNNDYFNNCQNYDSIIRKQGHDVYQYIRNNQHTLQCIQNYHVQDITYKNEPENIFQEQFNNYDSEGCRIRYFWYNKDLILAGNCMGENNGYIYTNKEVLKNQKNIIGPLFTKIGKQIIQGKPLWRVSLPIQMFEPKSMLERCARSFGNIDYLRQAGIQEEKNVIESIKFLTCFYLSSFSLAVTQQNPFNPILGETFQCRIDGDPLYYEQISHHPPISYYLLIGENYKLTSPHSPILQTNLSSVTGKQTGNPILTLKNGLKLYYIWFPIRLKGLLIGERIIQAAERSFCFEPKSRIICELQFDSNNKENQQFYYNQQDQFYTRYDAIIGGIYKVTEKCIERFIEGHKYPSQKELSININEDVEEFIEKAQGSYTKFLKFNGVKYWDHELSIPYIIDYEQNCLPSDSRYRIDSLGIKREDKLADKFKDELEEQQRQDRILREKYQKNIQKNKNK